jgi:hypothetical protein
MSIISDHQNGAAMKKVLASMGWVAAGLIGALIFYAFPDYRIHIEIILGVNRRRKAQYDIGLRRFDNSYPELS